MTLSGQQGHVSFDDLNVGQRLVQLRERLGLSQRELARRAGIPNGNISQIEQGKVSPTIQSLQKILAATGVTMADFFAVHFDCFRPVIPAEAFFKQFTDGTESSLLTFEDGHSPLTIRRDRLSPGARLEQKWNNTNGLVLGLVLHGEIQLGIEELNFTVQSGDAFNYRSQRRCSLLNTSNFDALLVSVLVR